MSSAASCGCSHGKRLDPVRSGLGAAVVPVAMLLWDSIVERGESWNQGSANLVKDGRGLPLIKDGSEEERKRRRAGRMKRSACLPAPYAPPHHPLPLVSLLPLRCLLACRSLAWLWIHGGPSVNLLAPLEQHAPCVRSSPCLHSCALGMAAMLYASPTDFHLAPCSQASVEQ